MKFLSLCGRALAFLLLMSLLTGGLYTLAVTGIAKAAFPYQAGGSIFEAHGKQYAELLGQPFSDPRHLWGRVLTPDTGTFKDKDGRPLLYAWPSNLSPAGETYAKLVRERVERLRAAHPEKAGVPVPVELVTGSGSGLDPHISVAAAYYQIPRLARNTGLTEQQVKGIIDRHTQGRQLGVFGEPRVNVLKVNLALDGLL